MRAKHFFGFILMVGLALGQSVATAAAMGYGEIQTKLVTEYGYSPDEALKIVTALETGTGGKLPITGMIYTSGLSFSFFLGTGYWQNLHTTFLDTQTGKTIASSCLYDMTYHNGGLAANIGYKWVLLFPFGNLDAATLAGKSFGRGIGISVDPAMGLEVEYLPGEDGGLIAVNPQVGLGAGIRFPKIDFVKASECRP